MTWQQSLVNNLIVFLILGSIFIVVYCKMSGKTLRDLIQDIRGGLSDE